MHRFAQRPLTLTLAALTLLAGCVADDEDAARQASTDTITARQVAAPATPAVDTTQRAQPTSTLRIEVNTSARELYVFENEERVATYPVAVGTEEWPTQTGEWSISQVVWNPEWVPPPGEEWAEDEERKAPGAEDNPLGRVQMVYDPPRTIHGTNEPASIGKAASHGSIRMNNEAATELARRVMEAGGASRDEAWFRRVEQNRTQKQVVDLPNPVPIRVT